MDLEKKEYEPIEVEDIKEISSTQREKMLQKSAKYLPDNPADSGMRASAVKPKFYGFVTDSSDSMMAYHNETVRVLNERLKAIKEKVNLEFGQNATNINDIIDEITLIYKALEVEVANRNLAIEQAISNLVNNSPEALDTLHELAQALGNDPNFATTILNVINEKHVSAKQHTDSTVESEASERQSQDNVVLNNAKSYTNTKISEEVSNRNIAIENAISEEVANRNSAIADEISARQTADNALSQRIDNILGTEGDISTIEGAYDKACQYADTLISNLINNSPKALDTLSEIAQALGEDPNFATTITNLINQKYNEALDEIPTKVSQLSNDKGYITTIPYGTTAGTACQGNDTRLSNPRPASDVHSWAKASSKPNYSASEVGAEPAFSKNTAFNKNFGSSAGTVCQGNDSRLSNSRPASDVYPWAKQASKPSYSASEISGLANVAKTGKYSDLIEKPTIPSYRYLYVCQIQDATNQVELTVLIPTDDNGIIGYSTFEEVTPFMEGNMLYLATGYDNHGDSIYGLVCVPTMGDTIELKFFDDFRLYSAGNFDIISEGLYEV